MAQLTSLKHLTEKRNSEDNLKALSGASEEAAKSMVDKNPKKYHSNLEGSKRNNRTHRQRSRRNLMSSGGQRQDLGTVMRPDLGKIDRQKTEEEPEEGKSLVGDFVGTISSLLFGRKGGLL